MFPLLTDRPSMAGLGDITSCSYALRSLSTFWVHVPGQHSLRQWPQRH